MKIKIWGYRNDKISGWAYRATCTCGWDFDPGRKYDYPKQSTTYRYICKVVEYHLYFVHDIGKERPTPYA